MEFLFASHQEHHQTLRQEPLQTLLQELLQIPHLELLQTLLQELHQILLQELHQILLQELHQTPHLELLQILHQEHHQTPHLELLQILHQEPHQTLLQLLLDSLLHLHHHQELLHLHLALPLANQEMLVNLQLVSLEQMDMFANTLQPIVTMESLALPILATPKPELAFTPSKLDANALTTSAVPLLQPQTTSTTARLLCTTQPLKPAKSSQFLEPSTTTALLHHSPLAN
jgi:hypothetical protein